MISVVVWRWGQAFGPVYVNRLHSMLARNLKLEHQLFCVTDNSDGIDKRVECVPAPAEFSDTPRCRRRMWQYSEERHALFGKRMLCVDLDMVITADITKLIDRPEPLVMLRISYANKLTPAFLLCDTGALHGAYEAYRDDPEGYPAATGIAHASDLAMLNHYLTDKPVAEWRERDHGFAIYFGKGYRRHGGLCEANPRLPDFTRVVILGGRDKHVLEEGRFDWVRTHWR